MRAAIVLAGGSSRRFGRANKLLAKVGGEPLVARAVRAARAAPVGRVIVVTGADRARIARAARAAGRVALAHAPDHREGIAASLRAGLAALWPGERALLLFLADAAPPPRGLVHRLARALAPGVAAARPRGGGAPGHPVLLRRPAPATIARLRGDSGLAPLLTGAQVAWIEVPPAALHDVDRPADLARLTRAARAAKARR